MAGNSAGLIGALVLAAACGSPPGVADPDAAAAFDWVAAIDGIEPALLSACGAGDEVIAVGGRDGHGLLLEWTGDRWQGAVLVDDPATLWWCAAAGAGAWAVGERATVLRRDDAWRRVDTGAALPATATLYGVWSDGSDTWVVGGEPTAGGARPVIARHRDGAWAAAATASLPAGALFKVWASGPDDVWAVGTGGLILHHDGQSWSAVASPTDERLIAVWGTAADDVYAVGGDGAGLVLRWDGASWTRFAGAPEPLSGVWRAAGGPLYVGGNRGWLGRFAAPGGGVPLASALTSAAPIADVDVHALHGAGASVIAVGADLLGGGDPSWRGRLLVHGGGFGGEVSLAPDAGLVDASLIDGGPGPGPGQVCGQLPTVCADGLECWLLLASDVAICTQYCDSPADCTAYGPDACCELPGFQALDPVCIPATYPECPP